jgi:lysophospholipase L1-like esterase
MMCEVVVLIGFTALLLLLIFIAVFRRRDLVNYLISTAVVLAMLAVAEGVFSRLPQAHLSDFVQLRQGGIHAACYPDAEDTTLPIKVTDNATGKEYRCVEDNESLRQAGYFPQRPDGALIVGDSFAYGGGVPENQTLASFLDAVFPRYNFLNYGRSGADVAAVAGVLQKALEEHPDVKYVMYFYNINDVLVYGELRSQQKFINDLELVRLNRIEQYVSPLGQLLSHSALYRFINQMVTLRWETALTTRNYVRAYDPRFNAQGLAETAQTIVGMDRLVARRGGRLVVIIYPLLYRTMGGGYPFEPVHQRLAKICADNGIAFVDGYGAFAAEKSLKPLQVHPLLDYHPNGRANELMVEYLSRVSILKKWFASD